MTDDLEQLKSDYRGIKAPPHLATRIRAEVADTPLKSHSWMPAAATFAVVLAVAWVLPFAWQPPSTDPLPVLKPSLSTLASLKPIKPAGPVPGLSQLRTVKVPAMPPKPKLTPPAREKTYLEFENEIFKEKHHANI